MTNQNLKMNLNTPCINMSQVILNAAKLQTKNDHSKKFAKKQTFTE